MYYSKPMFSRMLRFPGAAASAGMLSALTTAAPAANVSADAAPVVVWALDAEKLEFHPVEDAVVTGDVPAGEMILEIAELEEYCDALFALSVS